MLPFVYIPHLMVIHLVRNSVLWLNAFPSNDSWSVKHSPQYIMMVKQLDYTKDVWAKFGEYMQMHEEHDSGMSERTIDAGPTGNQKGGHYFMSLATGEHLVCSRWTILLMPCEVQNCVNEFGKKQKMPNTLTFANHHRNEIQDDLD